MSRFEPGSSINYEKMHENISIVRRGGGEPGGIQLPGNRVAAKYGVGLETRLRIIHQIILENYAYPGVMLIGT
ncbi:aconitate hydratase, mitochondrial-like protein [Lates japonicus]|uniref:Aconitate hydratase, mitochondrial-like protein n=1 Tax=Lates japonicus TaxID=270547 RepID=A0AAD3MUH1_LATJO|nr:aconitate hydratase, mitochondrial-like protein [Lates japonicus]